MTAKKKIKGVTCKVKNGTEYWYARINGARQYCGIGDKGHKIAVAAKAKEIAKLYENHEVNAGLKVKRVAFKKVKELIDWYMLLPSIQAQKSYKRKITISKHLLNYFGTRPLNGVEADTQEGYWQFRLAQGAAEQTLNYEISMLSAAYYLGVKRKKIPRDMMPGEFVKKHGCVIPRRRIPEDDFNRVAEHAVSDDFRDFLICGYESAMRVSEIAAITAGQVHLDMLHISGDIVDYIDLGIFDTKTGARRTVPVSHRLKQILKRRIIGIDSEDRVFLRHGKPFYPEIVCKDMRESCEKAEVLYGDKPRNKKGERTGIVFHCLRHTRTSLWVEAGISDEIIRRATGHSTLAAYQRYVKLDPHVVMRLVDTKTKPGKNGTKSAQTL